MTGSEPIIDTSQLTVTSWRLDITNRFEPIQFGDLVHPVDMLTGPTIEATFEIADRGLYESLVGAAPTYTVQVTTDHNPWHREATGWRARARKLRDGLWWSFQRRILRRKLIKRTVVTVPNCQIVSQAE